MVYIKNNETKEKIGKALLNLLNQKDLSNITVSEICRQADINRSTFYYYYESPAEAIEDIRKAITYLLRNFVEEYTNENGKHYYEMDANEQVNVMNKVIYPVYLKYIRDNKEYFKVVTRNSSVFKFDELFHSIYKKCFESTYNQLDIKDKEIVFKYYFSGELALINDWINQECKDSIEELINRIDYCERLSFDFMLVGKHICKKI